MKEAFVDKNISVTIRDTDIPVAEVGQVLVRVVISGTSPKDWKLPLVWPADSGGGRGGLHKGDKVAAFHQVMKPHGSYAEYAIVPENTTFHIPAKTSFEEAATIPLAAMTAALRLYQPLKLPLPWNPATEPLPLIVYGGTTAVGAFAIKLAQLSNIHPLITVADKGSAFVETLIDRQKGDTIIDYREGDEVVRAKIKEAAGGHGSHQNVDAVMTSPGEITTLFPHSGDYQPPEGVIIGQAIAGSVHMPPTAAIFLRYIPNLQMLDLSNYTPQRMKNLVSCIAEILKALVWHGDPMPRNMMIIKDDPDRIIWMDFDRAETYDEDTITKEQRQGLHDEYEEVDSIGQHIGGDWARGDGRLEEAIVFYC